jgi:type VI protein secretion system component Hcp
VPQWLWVPGAPGSPQNDGWLDLFSFSWSMSKDVTCSVALDSAYPKLMQMLVNGTPLDEIIIYREPNDEFHFLKALLTAAQTGGSSNETLVISFMYQTLERYLDGRQV